MTLVELIDRETHSSWPQIVRKGLVCRKDDAGTEDREIEAGLTWTAAC